MASKDLIDLDFFYSPTSSSLDQQERGHPQQDVSLRGEDHAQWPLNIDIQRSQEPPLALRRSDQELQQITAANIADQDDDFGDFETGTTIAGSQALTLAESNSLPENWTKSTSPGRHGGSVAKPVDSQSSHVPFKAEAERPLRSLQTRLKSVDFRDVATTGGTGARPVKAKKSAAKASDENILFDADDLTDDDDFGDFEGPQGSQRAESVQRLEVRLAPIDSRPTVFNPPQKKAVGQSLLDLDDYETPWTAIERPAAASTSMEHWTSQKASPTVQSAPRATQIVPPQRSTSQKISSQTKQPPTEEAWDDFEETTPTTTVPGQAPLDTGEAHADDFDAWDDFNEAEPQLFSTETPLSTKSVPSQALNLPVLFPDSHIPSEAPTYVPPPVVLLSIFAPIFQTVATSLLDPLSSLPRLGPERSAVLNHKSTYAFLDSFLMLSNALGRVVAGRKQRWQRDNLLSQSMRVRPMDSGGAKPTGIYKSEALKEDGEVAEVVQAWRAIVGKLKYTVVAAGMKAHVPEISENMTVRPAEQSEVGFTAPRPCSVCGLKRKERVTKVDVDVQDNFGEWWVDHWGHRDCALTWLNYKDRVRGG